MYMYMYIHHFIKLIPYFAVKLRIPEGRFSWDSWVSLDAGNRKLFRSLGTRVSDSDFFSIPKQPKNVVIFITVNTVFFLHVHTCTVCV